MRYVNTNGLIKNLEVFEKERKAAIIWSEDEKRTFREKFSQFPKDFEKIASALELKSCADCILFYYQNKKKEGFRSRNKKKKAKVTAPRAGSMKSEANKQKQQLQHQQQQGNKPNIFNFDVPEYHYIDDEEDYDEEDFQQDIQMLTENPEQQQQNISITDSNTSDNGTEDSSKTSESSETNTKQAQSGKRSTQPTKVINTRSKFKTNNATQLQQQQTPQETQQQQQEPEPEPPKLQPSLESETISTTEECMPTAMLTLPMLPVPNVSNAAAVSEGGNHPPLRMTIIVTSPSHVKENASIASVASIVKETVTAASGFVPEPQVQSKDDLETSTDTASSNSQAEPSTEDLIRQHLSKMPGTKLVYLSVN